MMNDLAHESQGAEDRWCSGERFLGMRQLHFGCIGAALDGVFGFLHYG